MIRRLAHDILVGGLSMVSSAILQIDSTIKGVLLPRMTTIERDAITSPTNGLVIYNVTTNTLDTYTSSIGWASSGTIVSPTVQTITTGGSNSVQNNANLVVINPVATINSLVLDFPITNYNGQRITLSFGGDLQDTIICSSLVLPINVLGEGIYTDIWAGDTFTFQFDSSANLWRLIGVKHGQTALIKPIRRINTNTTATIYDHTLICTDTLTVTLPETTTCKGLILNVKNRAGFTKRITIATQGADLLDNNNAILYNNSLMLQSDGVGEWIKI